MADTATTRRDFMKKLGSRLSGVALGAGLLYPLGKTVYELTAGEEKTGLPLLPGAKDVEKNSVALGATDYLGAGNFAHSIASLAKNHHLADWSYFRAVGLLGAKYALSGEEGQHELIHELNEGLDALCIILGTTIAAEGLTLDLDAVTRKKLGRDSTLEEKLYMITMLAPLSSMTTTTVGSSTIFRKQVHQFVDEAAAKIAGMSKDGGADKTETIKKKMYADLISHVSNNSGFMFLGDPPFIAMIQKYGTAGFAYQNKTMWAPSAYSSVRILAKMSQYIESEHGFTIRKPIEIISDKGNRNLLASILNDTFMNLMRYGYNVLGDDSKPRELQDSNGVQFNPLSKFEDRAVTFGKVAAKYTRDWAALFKSSEKLKRAKELTHGHYIKEQLEHNVGPNMADVLTVFPFQALSIPFLRRPFGHWLQMLEPLPPAVRDAALYLSIAGFSSIADNYVACKIGLDLFPDRPEIPLSASIIGGSLLPPGNMANLSLVDQGKYSLKDGTKNLLQHMDMLGFGFAYAEAIPYLRKLPVIGSLYGNSGILKALSKR